MNAPPRVASWLLELTLRAADRAVVAGDLYEEFNRYVVPERGLLLARWWYRWQVARSLAPLFFRSWERASLTRSSAAVVIAALIAIMPAVLLMMLRTFVLQQVPLKTTSELSVAFAVALGVTALCAFGFGLVTAARVLDPDSRER